MLKLWGPRALAALQLGLMAASMAYRDAGLRTMPQGEDFVGACSTAEAQLAGLLWLAMVLVALAGSIWAMLGRSKWRGLALFLVPLVAATITTQYQQTHYPACWDEHGNLATGAKPAVPMK